MDKNNGAKGYIIASTFAVETIIIVGLFTLVGYLLDQWINTVFVFTLIFILLGVFFGVYNVIKKINNLEDKNGK